MIFRSSFDFPVEPFFRSTYLLDDNPVRFLFREATMSVFDSVRVFLDQAENKLDDVRLFVNDVFDKAEELLNEVEDEYNKRKRQDDFDKGPVGSTGPHIKFTVEPTLEEKVEFILNAEGETSGIKESFQKSSNTRKYLMDNPSRTEYWYKHYKAK